MRGSAQEVEVRAEQAGLSIIRLEGRVEARKGRKVIAFHVDPNKCLDKALERLEEDRLRNLRDDTEPVLKVKRGKKNGHAAPPSRAAAQAVARALVEAAPVAPPYGTDGEAAARVGRVISGSIVKDKYRKKYKANNYSCGDFISEELREFIVVVKGGRMVVDLVKLKQVAEDNGVWKESYSQLNVGQQRMTIGNRLRSKYNDGGEIVIGGAPFVKEFD